MKTLVWHGDQNIGYEDALEPQAAPLTVQEWVSEHYSLVSATPPGPECRSTDSTPTSSNAGTVACLD